MGNWFSSGERFPITKRNKRKYGWIRDLPDHRDVFAQFPNWNILPETKNVDLRETGNMPDVYNQKSLGSCTAQALAGAFEYDIRRQKCPEYFTPSRLFIYYNERVIEGTVEEDSGASLRDGIKVIHKIGVPSEKEYPYDISRFQVQPSMSVYMIAQKNKTVKYRRVPQNNNILSALLLGFPVTFGMAVYEYFESSEFEKSGILKVPGKDERLLGGHAVLLCGYRTVDNESIQFLVRNSWGPEWCQEGYFWMEYAYIMDPNLCADFWIIEKIQTADNIQKEPSGENISITEEEINLNDTAPNPAPILPNETVPLDVDKELDPKFPDLGTELPILRQVPYEEPYMFGSDSDDD